MSLILPTFVSGHVGIQHKNTNENKETNKPKDNYDLSATSNKRIAIRVCFPRSWCGRSGGAEGKTRDGTFDLLGRVLGLVLLGVYWSPAYALGLLAVYYVIIIKL